MLIKGPSTNVYGTVVIAYRILAAYIAEQCLVACVLQSRCPICTIESKGRGKNITPKESKTRKARQELHTIEKEIKDPDTSNTFEVHGLRAVYPFWATLNRNLSNIFECFTPNLLHQIHKGIFKDHIFN